MSGNTHKTQTALPLSTIHHTPTPTVADQVFDELQKHILTLELPPSTKISETEVANKMGVSRQPVREAFKRLAKLGFLEIRPQSGTKISLISEESVLRARFIRIALEVHTCQAACDRLTPDGINELRELIELQRAAVSANDRVTFHKLDDEFHQKICVLADVGYVWDLIRDSKAHMDRIRMLSLNETSQRFALEEHIEIVDAIAAQDTEIVAQVVKKHLSRILTLIEEIKATNHSWFTDGQP